MSGLLICFTGADGSGKTTNARLLLSSMKARNLNAHYVWNRLEAPLLKPITLLASLLLLRTSHVLNDYSKYMRSKKFVLRSRPLLKVYVNLLMLDLLVQVLFKISPCLILKKIVICDRYVFDLIATIMADFGLSFSSVVSLLRIPFEAFPRPEIAFLMDVPETVAFIRKQDVPSIEFLRRRREAYLTIARKFKMVVLDGSHKLGDLHATIWRTVDEAYPS